MALQDMKTQLRVDEDCEDTAHHWVRDVKEWVSGNNLPKLF